MEGVEQNLLSLAPGSGELAASTLDLHAPAAAPEMRDEIEAEAGMMRDLAQRAEYDDPGRLSKLSDEDWHMKMRKRGRRRRS
jgi:hypothetical protein